MEEKIKVVLDPKDVAEAVKDWLERRGYRVETGPSVALKGAYATCTKTYNKSFSRTMEIDYDKLSPLLQFGVNGMIVSGTLRGKKTNLMADLVVRELHKLQEENGWGAIRMQREVCVAEITERMSKLFKDRLWGTEESIRAMRKVQRDVLCEDEELSDDLGHIIGRLSEMSGKVFERKVIRNCIEELSEMGAGSHQEYRLKAVANLNTASHSIRHMDLDPDVKVRLIRAVKKVASGLHGPSKESCTSLKSDILSATKDIFLLIASYRKLLRTDEEFMELQDGRNQTFINDEVTSLAMARAIVSVIRDAQHLGNFATRNPRILRNRKNIMECEDGTYEIYWGTEPKTPDLALIWFDDGGPYLTSLRLKRRERLADCVGGIDRMVRVRTIKELKDADTELNEV
jgi:hypothetical protein